MSAVSLGRVGNLNSKPMRRQWIQSKWIYEVSAELSFGSPLKMAKTNLIFPTANANTLKYISLLTLTLQNAILGLSMRYARTRPGEIFLSSTGAQRCIVGIHPIYPHHRINICNLSWKLSKCLPNYIGCTRSSCSIRIYNKEQTSHTLHTDKQYLQACCLLSLRMYVHLCWCVGAGVVLWLWLMYSETKLCAR